MSTIIIFKRCKFNVNLWTWCFVLQKVPKSFNESLEQTRNSAWVNVVSILVYQSEMLTGRFHRTITLPGQN